MPQLKKHVGHAIFSPSLSMVGIDGDLPKVTIKIVDHRMVKPGNHAVIEVLVEWANSFLEDATWEIFTNFCKQHHSFDP